MVKSSDRMCVVDYDSIIVVVLIVFSLYNISLYMYLNFPSYFSSINSSNHEGITYLP